MVKHSGHVLLWEGVIGVAHQQAGFAHSTVPHHHTLEHLPLLGATAAAAAVTSLLAVHSCGSSCGDSAAAVASPASPEAHEAAGSQQQAPDHFALLWVPGTMQTRPWQLAYALLLTILVKKGNTHLGELLKGSVPFPCQLELRNPHFH